jgi:hypothetical protein
MTRGALERSMRGMREPALRKPLIRDVRLGYFRNGSVRVLDNVTFLTFLPEQ